MYEASISSRVSANLGENVEVRYNGITGHYDDKNKGEK